MSGPQPSELRCFNENSPRPPVPGEERGCFLSSSPDPQRSSCDATGAPLGYQPEGRCDRAIVMEQQQHQHRHQHQQQRADSATSPLACLQWTKSLRTLLGDPKGVELFEHYLHQEGNIYALYFWFACEGLKEERDPNRLVSIIKVLVRRFFQRPQLALPDDVRKEMTRRFREGLADKRMFDVAQLEVERIMEEGPYPNFLRSDVYLQYVRYCQCTAGVQQVKVPEEHQQLDQLEPLESKERIGSLDESTLPQAASLLPTLHEDSQFLCFLQT
ncbi:hypothetical protein QAD02_009023 [Eretmocerus hayati]|uniref:Uncharacterized protein n=1 Tax=Eretmocerus hayati TaxID=131215 RepID=A0ACC2N9J7_9HYME|nr:hypothetical protein QAD02_009023 [Eretmocerus hayati]